MKKPAILRGLIIWFAIAINLQGAEKVDVNNQINPVSKVATEKFSPDLSSELRIRQIWTGTIGDIYIIVAPDGKTTLVDCGWGIREGGEKCHEDVLFPALKEQNIKNIDQVIISHLHGDHFGALPFLLTNPDIKIGKIYWSYIDPVRLEQAEKGWANHLLMAITEALCKEKNIPLIDVKVNDRLDFGSGITGKILSIGKRDAPGGNWINNNSIVFRLDYKNFSMLFTGDCGFEEENDLMKSNPEALKVDVLKCAHHGGAGSTSPEFLQAVAPRVIVTQMPEWLSSDERGLRVEKLIKEAGIPYFRSWEYPQLSIVSDGNNFEFVNIEYSKITR